MTECEICNSLDGMSDAPPGPPSLDDAAMVLARRGYSAHRLAHTMMVWATVAAERAISWQEREAAR